MVLKKFNVLLCGSNLYLPEFKAFFNILHTELSPRGWVMIGFPYPIVFTVAKLACMIPNILADDSFLLSVQS